MSELVEGESREIVFDCLASWILCWIQRVSVSFAHYCFVQNPAEVFTPEFLSFKPESLTRTCLASCEVGYISSRPNHSSFTAWRCDREWELVFTVLRSVLSSWKRIYPMLVYKNLVRLKVTWLSLSKTKLIEYAHAESCRLYAVKKKKNVRPSLIDMCAHLSVHTRPFSYSTVSVRFTHHVQLCRELWVFRLSHNLDLHLSGVWQ